MISTSDVNHEEARSDPPQPNSRGPNAQRQELVARLRVAVFRLSRRLRLRSTDSISLSQLSALACLYRAGPLTPRGLSAREGVRPPSISRTVSCLEASGLITRGPHRTDGRQYVLALTERGTALIEQEIAGQEHWLEQELIQLSPGDRATLARAADIIDRITSRDRSQ